MRRAKKPYLRTIFAAGVLAVLSVTSGCGSATGPTQPPAALTISPQIDVLLVGSATSLAANARLANGTTMAVAPQWSTNNPGVLTIDPSGSVRGVANGTAVITAIYQGVSDSLLVRVAPNYNGQWSGTYRVTSCAQDAAFPISTLCSSASAAASNSLGLTLVQDKLVASGTLTLSFGSGQVTATIEPDGTLVVAADVRVTPYSVSVGEWRSTSRAVPAGNTREQMSGAFGLTWRADASAGVAHMSAATDDLTKATP